MSEGNKHNINVYDRMFLKSLDYGNMLPMAVIKNYDDATKEAFELCVGMLLDRLSNGDMNFGSIKIGEDEYYIAGCEDEFTRLNLISQGKALGQLTDENDEPLVCNMFNVDRDLYETGVAPIIRFDVHPQAHKSKVKALLGKMSGVPARTDDFELYTVKNGDERIVFARQLGGAEILGFRDKAKFVAMEILSGYRDIVSNVYKVEIDGKVSNNRLVKEDFDIAHNNQDYAKRTFEKEIFRNRVEREITEEDKKIISSVDLPRGHIVASVLKNSYISLSNLQKICDETQGVNGMCELVNVVGENGDKLMLFVVDKSQASQFAKASARIEAKLLNSSAKSFTIKMMNIDNKGRVMPAGMRLVARLETTNGSKIAQLEERFEEEQFEKLEPEIVRYGAKSYGVYVRGIARTSNRRMLGELPVEVVRDAIRESGIDYELTDAYGVTLRGGRSCYNTESVSKNSENSSEPISCQTK